MVYLFLSTKPNTKISQRVGLRMNLGWWFFPPNVFRNITVNISSNLHMSRTKCPRQNIPSTGRGFWWLIIMKYELHIIYEPWGDNFWIEMMIVFPVIVWMTDDRIVTQTMLIAQRTTLISTWVNIATMRVVSTKYVTWTSKQFKIGRFIYKHGTKHQNQLLSRPQNESLADDFFLQIYFTI